MNKADAIIVLGNRLRPDGSLGKTARARVDKGAELLRGGLATGLILTGGYAFLGGPRNEVSEAKRMKEYAVSLGIPESMIVLETQSADTIGNAYFTKKILAAHGWHSTILVTSETHLDRAMYIFKGVFGKWDIQSAAAPTVLSAQKLREVATIERKAFVLARIITPSKLAPAWCWFLKVLG